VVFILIATFTMLNLFISIIVNAMHSFTEAEAQETMDAVSEARDHMKADLHQEMAALRREIAAFKFLPGSGNQVVSPGVDLSSV
jgi:voltage-gated sodium channel